MIGSTSLNVGGEGSLGQGGPQGPHDFEGRIFTGRVQRWLTRLKYGFVVPEDAGLLQTLGMGPEARLRVDLESLEEGLTPEGMTSGSPVQFSVGRETHPQSIHAGRLYCAVRVRPG
eukprot:RCo047537